MHRKPPSDRIRNCRGPERILRQLMTSTKKNTSLYTYKSAVTQAPWGLGRKTPSHAQPWCGTATLPPALSSSYPRRGRQPPPSSLKRASPRVLRASVLAPEQLSRPPRPPRAPPSSEPPLIRPRARLSPQTQCGTATSPRRSAPRKLLAELLPPAQAPASTRTASFHPTRPGVRAGDCGRCRPPFLRRAHPFPAPPALFHFPPPVASQPPCPARCRLRAAPPYSLHRR